MKQLGEARVVVELKDGIITATHGAAGDVLYRGTADDKSWDMVIAGITNSCNDGEGSMRHQTPDEVRILWEAIQGLSRRLNGESG